jgi:hypothetical protein
MTQAALQSLYSGFLARASVPPGLASRLSCPLLLSIGTTWSISEQRLLLIGQETRGWAFRSGDYYDWPHPPLASLADFQSYDHAVLALAHAYAEFDFAKRQPANYRSPFWRAFRLFRERATSNLIGEVLWSNLFRCSLDGSSVINTATSAERQDILAFQQGLLGREIAVLGPTAVLFVTGPSYDFAIDSEFPGATWARVPSYDPRHVSRVVHHALPDRTFRTYHPNYLARSRERWQWLSTLSSEVFPS